MTITVEDGTQVTDANSYVDETDLEAYAAARGITLVTDSEQLLIIAMDYVESLVYKGIKVTKTQSLQWPRTGVYLDGYAVDNDEIPKELKNGLMECAIAIDQGDDPMQNMPIQTKREKVDVIEIEYAPGSAPFEINRRIKNTLWKLLASGSNGSNVVNVSKG